ncbi:non-ribosomal peptide synthetase/type I polyketide synthase [Saccharothrix xinjiangensis]|uniref:non-ribosomal peptide synthetase/type I polyketide synthase n=1 Tax=Saccharothrix xinjiangensis TaxID=204798 RepID=UPI0031E2B47D
MPDTPPTTLLGHPLVADAAVLTATTADGRAVRVAHVVPSPGVAPDRARRVVSALGAVDGDPLPLLVSVVSAIPRDRDGEPDEAALRRLPVRASVTAPVPLPAPTTGRRHLAEFVDLPPRWVAGPPAALDDVVAADLAGPSSLTATDDPDPAEDDPATLVEALLATARRHPGRGVHVVEGGGVGVVTYPELLDRAKRVLAGLRAAGLAVGDAAVLHTPSLAEHVVALWACLLGGVRPVAVAQSATYAERTAVLDKLEHAWRDLGEPVVLSGGATVAGLRGHAERSGLTSMRVLDLAGCAEAEPVAEVHRPEPGAVAVLQLSSGSTGRSKVIQVTHRGLVRYARAARQVSRMDTGDVFVNWLPLDHVAGVVMYHFGPVVLGCDNVHVPTADVLADPLRWLDLLHEYRAQHSWSPNFGFGLVADALATADPARTWDLTPLRALVNAGEQCTEPVVRRFLAATGRFGVSDDTVLLAWGMAETCTAITYQAFGPDAVQHVRQAAGGGLELLAEPAEGSSTFLSMGRPAPGSEFRVVGPDGTTVLPELRIGRLQGRSARITPGYLDNPEANAEAFPDGDWFDTGDLAFVAAGRVTITGRAKEIIINNGVHYYCHEIEDVVGALPGVATSFVGAFGVPDPDGGERLAVVFVPADGLTGRVVGEVRRRLAERFGLVSVLLAAVDRDGFAKTTSGKIQRTAMRARLLRGELDDRVRAVDLAESARTTLPDALHRPVWAPRSFTATRDPGRVRVFGDPDLAAAVPGAAVLDPDDPDADVVVLVAGPDEERASVPVLDLVARLAGAGWTGELVSVGRAGGCAAALTASIAVSAALERPGLRAWHLELPGGDDDPELLARALTWVHREPVIAWRDRPLVRSLEPVEPVPDAPPAAEPGSCWLVTGGLGGIGRVVLPGLGLRLLVVGRGPATDLAGLGPDARHARVDVADADALEAAVVEAEAAWGEPLAGVLHLAGTYEIGQLADLTAARWRAQTRTKVAGSQAVAEVLRRRPGSRLIAFSTLLTWFPAVGTAGYTAGNRYLEALAGHLGADHPVHTLVWGLWRSTGLNEGHEDREAASRGKLLAFTAADGNALFTAALRQPPGTILLGVDRANPAARRMLPAEPLEGATTPGRDAFGVDLPVAPAGAATEATAGAPTGVAAGPAPGPARVTGRPTGGAAGVRRLVRETLREVVPGGLGPDTPFYEAGLGSLGLVRLHAALQRALGREFPLTALYAHPNEAALGAHLSELTGDHRAGERRGDRRDRRVAIIGMAARFPGAPTLERYWENLLAGVVSTTRFGREELIAAGIPARLVDDPAYVPVSGALDDIAGFDAELFGISPAEAAITDPQQRLFLQVCHQALEHAGYAGAGGRVGVYAGSGMTLYSLRTYLRENLGGADPGDQLAALQVAIGNEPDFLATRVAYRLGLTGPAVTVRSACSTSLVAVHSAITALLAGDADMALAGAAALHVPGIAGYRYEPGSILSATGRCRAFDAAADGTVGGNGVAAVLLKPLDAALADGDTVHAVVLGSAINNDGAAKVGYTSPGVAGQTAVVRDALAAAGVPPGSIGYVEAHGTGTAVGDPIEVEALRGAFAGRAEPLLVGSVKSNIGHLDSAAGMAGLLKAVLALRAGTVPPQANFDSPNPALRLDDGLIAVPTAPTPWPLPGVRRAGVTALGVGGTNAHVVLEQAPDPVRADRVPPANRDAPWVAPLSARTPEALAHLAAATADALGDADPADVLTTLGAGRGRLPHRLVAWGGDAAETARDLRAGGSACGVARHPGPLVFAFAGQGVDCSGAGAPLLAHPVSAAVLRGLLDRHRRDWGVDLLPPLLGEPHEWTTATLQPALLAVQLAQAALLAELGVRPEAVVGHSAGEYAALAVAGALSHEDALHLAAVRGALMQSAPEGALLAVFDDVEEPAGLSVAVRNGPRHTVFGGPPEAVAEAERSLAARGVEHRRLAADRAFHTSAVDPVLDALGRQAAALGWKPLSLPVHSGVGAVLAEGTVPGPDHVRAHTRSTADFRGSVDGLVADGCTTFVELGPSGVLSALGRQWPGTTWLPLLRRGGGSVVPGLAALFCHGVEVDWAALAPGGGRVPLPTYPFRPTRHWIDPVPAADPVPVVDPVPAADHEESAPAVPAEQDRDLDESVLTRVRELTARHLGDKPDRITPDVPFFDLGADSLLMINMVRELEVAFGVRVAMRELFEEVDTPARLAEVITERMSAEKRAELAPTPAPAPPPAPLPTPAPSAPLAPASPPTPTSPPMPTSPPVPTGQPAPAAVAPTPAPPPSPPSTGHEAVVREQLNLMDRFTRIMSEQLALLANEPAAPAPAPAPVPTSAPAPTQPEPPSPRPVEGTQLGPRPTIAQGSGMSGGRLDPAQRAHLDDLVARYTARTRTSKDIAQRFRRPLADSRAVVGFRGVTKELLYPLAARRARGAHLEDVDGNTYVDITMGFGVLMFGHDPDFVTDAVAAYQADGLRLGPRGPETGEAAELLAELTGLDRVAFSTSGTEANSAAFRLARAYTGRTKIVTFDGSYHGHFDPVLGRTVPDGDVLRTVPVSAGVPASAVAESVVLPYGDESSLDVIRRRAGEIAAVVLEAVPSRYPQRQPVEFVRALRRLCDETGIVLMFDEMLTGFRPHPQGAQGIFGVKADLATYGKLIGGGYPIGAIAGRADIMDWVDGGFWRYGDDSVPEGETTFFGGTYIQHPLAMVAAKAVLTHLRDRGPGLQQAVNARTERLATTLNDFFAAEDFPLSVHRFGSLFRFAHRGNLELLFHHLVMEGVHVWEWRNFFLSTAHTDADVDFVVDAVRNSLHDLRRGGFLPGRPAPAPAPRRALPRIPRAVARTAPVEAVSTEVGRTTPDFSLYFFGDYPRDRDGDKYAAILSAARFADRSGLHAVWLPERHFDSFGGVFPNPSVLAAAIAAQTSRVRLHSGSVVLPLHDPIRVAEEWSVVDNLSGGRVSIGVASGWHARDFVLAPGVYGRHREAMYEGVEAIRALWRGDAVTRTAGNGEEVEVRLHPTPVQPEPDFYTAIVGNPESYERAARGGFGVITNLMAQGVEQLADNIARYRRTRAEVGLDPGAGRVVLLLHTYLGDDTERVRAEAFGPFCDYLRSSLSLFGQVTNSLGFSIDLEHTNPEDLEYLLSRAYERYCADRALIGTPDDAAPIVRALAGLGVDEVACFVDFGLPPARITAGLPGIDVLRGMFAETPPTGPLPADAPPADVRAASPTEQQIWYVEQTLPGRPTHNETIVVALEGELDTEALRAALAAVVARHDGLRSTFHDIDGELKRVVAAPAEFALPVREDPGASVEEAARRVVERETSTPFDVARGPLFEPYLVRLDADRRLLVLRMHHLVIDTVSAGVLTGEIAEAYRAAATGADIALPAVDPLPAPRPPSAEALAYWTDLLAGAPRELDLPADHPRPQEPSGRGGSVGSELDAGATAALRAVARAHRVTPFMALLAGWAVALRVLGGKDDLVVGTPFAHRPEGAERAVGFFVHTLPLRIAVDDDASFAELLKVVRGQVLGAQEHREAPFPEIVRALGGNPDPLRNPLFDTVVEYDNEAAFELDLPGVRSTLVDVAVDRAPVDLVLFLTNLGDTVRCRLNHALDLVEGPTARRVLDTYLGVLAAAVAAPDRPLRELDVLTPDDAALLDTWADGGPPPHGPALLHDGVPARLGDAVAVVEDGRGTTGAELRDRAAAVAGAIAGLGVPAGTPVAVLLPRGADAVAAVLGALTAGVPYVPLDPEQPPARLGHMLRKAGVAAVVTAGGVDAPGGLPTILVDRLSPGPAVADRPLPPAPAAVGHPLTPDDVAYVLFTSGSTGEPKGAVVEHRSIANTLGWYTRDLGLTSRDRLSWFASPGFDASVIEVWPALRVGAPLHVVPPGLRHDPAGLRDWLVDTGITVAFAPTPVGELLLDQDWSTGPVALRHLVVGGDVLRRRPPAGAPFRLWNVYGPTEAAVVSTWAEVPPTGDGLPTIGRPVPGTRVRVVDGAGRRVPVGVPGELLLGGAQLARGYADPTPEQAARFTGAGADRAYRTGDVVRWRADGELEFLRRRDRQVQIRGFRVEPGEVEHQLTALPGVREAAVRALTDADGTVRLAAHVVPAPGAEVADLRAELATRLPEYMVPATWDVLEALPLTTSGKIDRSALPEPSPVAPASSSQEPEGDLERGLSAMWAAELGRESVPPGATFFELGGHSLTAIRLVNRIRAELGVRLDVPAFLRAPTVRGLAALLAPADPGVEVEAPASWGQRHGYRVTATSAKPSVLTIAMRFALHGRLDVAALRRALTALVARHAALRTRLREVDGRLRQEVLVASGVPLRVVEVAEPELDGAVLAAADEAPDLTRAGTFRATLFTASDRRSELLLAVHHSFSDGWSTTVLVRDLAELYRAEVAGRAPDLPDLTATYVDFTEWEAAHLSDPATRAAVEEWADHVGSVGARPLLFPTDRPRSGAPLGDGAVRAVTLPPGLAAGVDALAARRGTTTFAVLTAAFAALAHEVTGTPASASVCGVANRPEARFEDVVGVFTLSSWVVVPVAGVATFDDLVEVAKDAVWRRLALQSVPAPVLNEAAGGKFAGNPPRVIFGFFNDPIPHLELTGAAPAAPVDVELPVARAEQTWVFSPNPAGGLDLVLEYATDLFDADTVAGWAARFVEILTAGVADPGGKPWRTP